MTARLTARLTTLVVALLTVAVVAPASAIPPGGASPDTPGTSASVNPTRVSAGERISFTVSGFPAGETVNVKIDDGRACTEAAVHGACVYHQQRISSSGTVSGSFTLPADLPAGAHWLRFLASAPIMRDGQQVGVKGFTARGNSDFTVVTSNGSSSSNGGGSAGKQNGTGGGAAAGSDAAANAAAGGVVAVKPNDPKGSATPATTTPPDSAGPDATVAGTDQTTTASSDAESGFPWIGVAGLVGLVALSFVGSRLAMSRRQ